MRLAAQVALLSFPLTFVAALRMPLLFFGGVQLVYGAASVVIAWYVLFTLPREIVDRLAERQAQSAVASQVDNAPSLGLGGYRSHRA